MKTQSLSRLSWAACVAAAFVPALVVGGIAAAGEQVTLKTQISIPPGGTSSFDISFDDPVIATYILSDRTNKAVDVVDTVLNQFVTLLGAGLFQGAVKVGGVVNNDVSGPNGSLIADHRFVWAGDGPTTICNTTTGCSPTSTVKVFDLQDPATFTSPKVIPTNGFRRSDELCLDSRDHLIQIANDAESDIPGLFPFISFIPTEGPGALTVVKQIKMDGASAAGPNGFGPDHGPLATNGIEQCKWSPRTGKIYLNIPEVNGSGADTAAGAVLVINPEKMIIENMFTINHNNCAGPQGMALGPNGQILLGCNAASGNGQFSTVVIDENDGHIVATIANESGSDEVWFNPGDDHYFLARSTVDANAADAATGISMLGVIDAATNTADPSFQTGASGPTGVGFKAHSVAADPVFNQVYVPIPANTATLASNNVCSSVGGDDSTGCIAVFSGPKAEFSCFGPGAPVIHASEGGDPNFFKMRCHH
jgi:hypothetical protein